MPVFVFDLLYEKVQLWKEHVLSIMKRERIYVFITLRYVAGASYLDISSMTRLPISSICARVDDTLADIDRCFSILFPLSDSVQLDFMSEGFTLGRSQIKGCVGAMDGLAKNITELSTKED